jgi:hypothetical protein
MQELEFAIHKEQGRLIRLIKRPGKLKCLLIRLDLKLLGKCYRALLSSQLTAINAILIVSGKVSDIKYLIRLVEIVLSWLIARIPP